MLGAPQLLSAQHGYPACVPHTTQVPEVQRVLGAEQMEPVQQGWFGPPQLPQTPPWQTLLMVPLQMAFGATHLPETQQPPLAQVLAPQHTAPGCPQASPSRVVPASMTGPLPPVPAGASTPASPDLPPVPPVPLAPPLPVTAPVPPTPMPPVPPTSVPPLPLMLPPPLPSAAPRLPPQPASAAPAHTTERKTTASRAGEPGKRCDRGWRTFARAFISDPPPGEYRRPEPAGRTHVPYAAVRTVIPGMFSDRCGPVQPEPCAPIRPARALSRRCLAETPVHHGG